jgi:hypothetical protein
MHVRNMRTENETANSSELCTVNVRQECVMNERNAGSDGPEDEDEPGNIMVV